MSEITLIKDMAKYTHDPLGWVRYAFLWGEGELENFDGPDTWQVEVLTEIKRQLDRGTIASVSEVIRLAVASGNGPGKSCLVCWLILWALATFEDTKGIVTANTENQLRTKTWSELAKWYRLSIAKQWFTLTATAIFSNLPEHEKTWRVDQMPWNENKPEAFAGLHNQGKRVILLFDEASSIPDIIWATSEGAMTDENTEIIWAVFGNPTRNSGRFHGCFNSHRHRWYTKFIDTRTCRFTNKEQIQKWVDDHGEDSDFVRVHVRGVFPHASSQQFIPSDIVEMARGKHLRPDQYNFAPVIIGVDCAWSGDDETVIVLRQGLMSKVLARYRRMQDDGQLAGYLAKFEDQYKADAVFIDLGFGSGLYSMGKQMGREWKLIEFGSGSSDPGLLNKRAEMWDGILKWLQAGGALPNDPILCQELVSVEYKIGETGQNYGKTYLEQKERMKKRGLASPDSADALALTFAFPVKSKGQKRYDQWSNYNEPYDPLSISMNFGTQKYNPLSPLAGRNLN